MKRVPVARGVAKEVGKTGVFQTLSAGQAGAACVIFAAFVPFPYAVGTRGCRWDKRRVGNVGEPEGSRLLVGATVMRECVPPF